MATDKIKETIKVGRSPIRVNSRDTYLGHDLRDKWLEAGREIGYRLRQVGTDKRGLSVIAFYAATHGLFAVLLVGVLLNW